ncbi:hypothetical protein ACFQ9V_14600 [Leifsonia sp. NPDC056665]|uniref:hypothetical protein n=1 Tax=Leifsonia sp. NPDC056665 TaxID=3345901 RepID=UPI00369FD527
MKQHSRRRAWTYHESRGGLSLVQQRRATMALNAGNRASAREANARRWYKRLTLAVSLLMLSATVGYSHWSLNSEIESARSSLEAQARQQDRAISASKANADAARREAENLRKELANWRMQQSYEGPVVRANAWISVWSNATDPPGWVENDPLKPIVLGAKDSYAYLEITVVNEGRFKATVTGVGIRKSDMSWVSGAFDCYDDAADLYSACDQRLVIESQKDARVRVLLSEASLRAACSSTNEEGLTFSIYARGLAPVEGKTWRKQTCDSQK